MPATSDVGAGHAREPSHVGAGHARDSSHVRAGQTREPSHVGAGHARDRRTRLRTPLLALLTLAACACHGADPPADSLPVAARGAYAAAFSADGTHAVVAALTQGASLWDLSTRQRRFEWNHRKDTRSTITAVAFSPEGNVAITVEGATLVLWDARKGEALRYFSAPAEVQAVALSRGGALALLGLQDGTALLMDANAGGVKRRFAHDGEVLAVALDPTGRRALTGSADGNARLWDTDAGTALHRWNYGAPVEVVAISADATRSFSAARNGKADMHDTDSGHVLGDVSPSAARRARGAGYTAGAFTADGASLLLGTVGGRVVLFDTTSSRLLENWKLPRDGSTRAAGSRVIALGAAGGNPLAASGDGVIHLLQRPSAR